MQKTANINDTEFIATATLTLAGELYREGRLADARDLLRPETDLESVLLLAKVEGAAKNHTEQLRLLTEHRPRFLADANPRLRARFHTMLAATYQDISRRDGSEYYSDKAFIEIEAAIFERESVGDFYDAGCAENNLALLLAEAGRSEAARPHLDRARNFFKGMVTKLAEVDDTEAQILLRERKYLEALILSTSAVNTFAEQGEWRLLREALPTMQKAAANFECVGV